ncbi:hypothetical protein OL229_09280 [Neisseriaceae bacterium JH1-16]|nr:hypothetical protein [Neisseriaceae bacterium JH1-16]
MHNEADAHHRSQIADDIRDFITHRAQLDNWEKAAIFQAIRALHQNANSIAGIWLDLARSELELAKVPPDQRSKSTPVCPWHDELTAGQLMTMTLDFLDIEGL